MIRQTVVKITEEQNSELFMSRRTKRFDQVEIIDIGDKGRAIGRKSDGEIILVDHAVPGDVVDVITTRKKKGLWNAIPLKWLKRSSHRVDPFCQHFGVCGGCKWQHLNYESQLSFKEKKVIDNLVRLGGFGDPEVLPIIPADPQRNYRNKMEYSFSNQRWLSKEEIAAGTTILERRALGLHPPGYFDKVVDIEHCYLQEGIANPIRNFVREYSLHHNYSYYNTGTHNGLLRSITIRLGVFTQQIMVNFSFSQKDEKIEALLQAVLEKFKEITSLNYCINPKLNESTLDLDYINYYGPGHIRETINHCTYQIGPKSFFQTNSFQARKMFEIIREMAGQENYRTLFDLYCGTGSIGLYLARPETRVVGIEEVEEAVKQARINQSINGIQKAEFLTGDAKTILNSTFTDNYGQADLIIIDPPRMGLHREVCNHLLHSGGHRIIYVSCNPATQARDLKILHEGYHIQYHQPIDMFPHTHHIENICLLVKRQK